MDHSYEEIRDVAIDLLAGREKGTYDLNQYEHLLVGIADVFQKRDGQVQQQGARPWSGQSGSQLSHKDREHFLEIFWGLFREGFITLGLNDSNREFPFFRISSFGARLLEQKGAYFFHDVFTFEKVLRTEIPKIDETTMIYLKESMQSFRSGCILASTVMLGVATEHTFLKLIEQIDSNPAHSSTYVGVSQQRMILQKVNKFKNILDQESRTLPTEIKEDLDTHFAGILSIIRNFRNQSGHPSGKIIDREQAYILLQLFVPYCKKMYKLIDHFS